MAARLTLLLLCSWTLLAQAPPTVEADAAWRDVLARAEREKKPIVIFFRSRDCERCPEFERESVPHPATQRRLPSVVFATLPAYEGEAAKAWSSEDPGVAFFDRAGNLRARWPLVPDTTNFGVILDSILQVAPDFERGELGAATGLARLGRITAARAALEKARASEDAETRQSAIVTGAILDANEGKIAEALNQLEQVVAAPITPKIASDAANAIETIRAVRIPAEPQAIRILPLARQVVSGRQIVRTHVPTAAVARVAFALDGKEVRRVEQPPFSATLDFGDVPERHAIRVVAFDRKGQEIGRDERVVNDAGETFWLRLAEPRSGPAGGAVRVTMNVRAPALQRVQRVTLTWNDAERAVLTAPPWQSTIRIPIGQVGVLRAVAELEDGRTSEDAVLLNASGYADQASVQLVELPITVLRRPQSAPGETPGASGRDARPPITAGRITVHEGNKVRRVESLSTAAETPLTIGLLIDASDSMQKSLPDVQEAAIRFLETILGDRDRAFIVTFDTHARIVQPATSDVALLRRRIMSTRLDGLTALHDAMALGLLQFEGVKGRRAMVVFTDGLDITSQYRAGDVAELARRVNVPIHLIATTPGAPAERSLTTLMADRELQGVARSTGGVAHALDDLAELPAVYARIEAALRAQILAFVRTDPATRENEWRGIRVEVSGEDLEVYAPEGYYLPW